MPGPTDVNTAFVDGGELVVIDGRATAWTFDSSVKKDAAGKEIPGPASPKTALVVNDKLIVLDGSDVWWTYNAASSAWMEGTSFEEVAMTKEEEEASKYDPWSKGPVIEASPVMHDEIRKAEALIASTEDKGEKRGRKKEAA